MAITVRCQHCQASSTVKSLPSNPLSILCQECKRWFTVENVAKPIVAAKAIPKAVVLPPPKVANAPRIVPVAAVVAKRPAADRPAAEWTPQGPPPKRPLNRAAVIGGVLTSSAILYILTAVVSSSDPSSSPLSLTFICLCIGGFCGGHFTAAYAEERKLRHSLQIMAPFFALVMGLFLGIVFASWMVEQDKVQEMMARVIPGWIGWGTVGIYLGLVAFGGLVCFLGGLSERLASNVARSIHARPRWTFETSDGQRIAAQGPWRYPILSTFWRIVGVLFLLTCWTPFLADKNWYTCLMDSAMFLVLWRACWVLARKREARSARDELDSTDKPPIVYLRSFRHDGRRLREGLWYAYTRMFLVLLTKTPEERLAERLGKFGPFVGIGKPGEDLPELGAGRMYVGDDDWQAVVEELLRREDSLAVIQAGETQGLMWELGKVGHELHPEQVLLFVPFAIWLSPRESERVYAEFRDWAQACLPTDLPERLEKSCFIYFTAAEGGRWRSSVLHKSGPLPKRHSLLKVLESLRETTDLWPGTNAYARRGMLAVSLFALVVLGGCLAGMFGDRPSQRSSGSTTGLEERPTFQPVPTTPLPAEEKVTHTGKAIPYRIALPKDWVPRTPAKGIDLSYKTDTGIALSIRVPTEPEPANEYPERLTASLGGAEQNDGKKLFASVELAERGTVEVESRRWTTAVIRARAIDGPVWLHVRAYSGPEGTFILTAGSPRDDREIRKKIAAAMDSFEMP